MDNERRTAYEALLAVEKNNAYSNLAVNDAISHRKPEDEAFVRLLVYGTIENRLYLEHRLSQLIKGRFEKLDPQIRVLLLMGAYQMDFVEKVPDYAAINESVNIARKVKRGLQGFVNGVLRNYSRRKETLAMPDREEDAVKYLSVKYSYNPDIVSMWIEMYGEERAESLLRAGNETAPLVLRVNTLKTDREKLTELLRAEGFETEEFCYGDGLKTLTGENEGSELVLSGAAEAEKRLISLRGSRILENRLFSEGLFSVQDPASALAVSTLGPKPGDTVLDLCAAPGGKSTLAAELMENRGRIISCDIYEHKLELMKNGASRLGIDIIETRKNDATVFNPEFEGVADKVIADVPCSGLGVVRRRPEIKLKMNSAFFKELAELQLDILQQAARYVKPGGILFYSTCTISNIENEGVLSMFLQKNIEFSVLTKIQTLPDVSNSDGFYFSALRRF